MHLAQIYTPGIAQCSYVIGSSGKCVVVDPVRNVEQYIDKAKEFGMDIVAVIETHLHADFVSGHMELAKATGAEIYAGKVGNCTFPHHSLTDGEEFTVGRLRFKMLETPGHTPDCTVFVVTDLARGEEPVLVFVGDTLLVGDVGRPDLFPNREEELAEKLFNSLKRLKELPDHLEIYPAHGMGSLCGRTLSAKLSSTLGTEKRLNYAMQYKNLEDFKKDILADMPAAPDHFARCSETNRTGPALLDELPPIKAIQSGELAKMTMGKGYSVLDTRSYHSFAAAHIPGSYSISKYSNLATFAGWIIPPQDSVILVMETEGDLSSIKKTLYNVGLDGIHGFLTGGIESWVNSGQPVDSIATISVHQLKDVLVEGAFTVLDNRDAREHRKGFIKGTTLVPMPETRQRYDEWDKDKPLYLFCGTGNRSMTAASLLQQRGFRHLVNVLGGINAWVAAGYSLESDGV